MHKQPTQRLPQQVGPVLYSITHIASCIGRPEILSDLQQLRARRETAVPRPDRAHAEHLARRREFLHWLQAPASSQLLVHGNYRPTGPVSGLSLFCLALANKISEYGHRFVPLVFFCGMHKDNDAGAGSGGRAAIRSFIYQLLGHMCFLGYTGVALSPQTLDGIAKGDMEALNWLFIQLMSLLPPRATVCCLLDGAVYYERDEFWDEFGQVLRPLLQLSGRTQARHAPLKLLITSPSPTSRIRELFPEDRVLSMAGIRGADMRPSTERLERELALATQHALQIRLEQEHFTPLFGSGGMYCVMRST